MRSKYKRVAMKKKMAKARLVPHKNGNPPRQSKGAEQAERGISIRVVHCSRPRKKSGED